MIGESQNGTRKSEANKKVILSTLFNENISETKTIAEPAEIATEAAETMYEKIENTTEPKPTEVKTSE